MDLAVLESMQRLSLEYGYLKYKDLMPDIAKALNRDLLARAKAAR